MRGFGFVLALGLAFSFGLGVDAWVCGEVGSCSAEGGGGWLFLAVV